MAQRVRKSWRNPRHTPSSSCRRPSFLAAVRSLKQPRTQIAEEQQHKQHALAAPPRYPRKHGRYWRTEEDEGDGVLDGFSHGLGRSKSSAPSTWPLAVRLLVITSSTTQNFETSAT